MNEPIFILLGSNKGNRGGYIQKAKEEIAAECGLIAGQSGIYETSAWGFTDQHAFLNQVIEIQSGLSANALLNKLLAIEGRLGRERSRKWGPREIDLDILFYGNEIRVSNSLTVPHPEIQNRRFTLVPLVEIAEGFYHPVLKKTCKQLLSECTDALEVKKVINF
jgi:2-amino-4-hydroxy-6-hydroxymethyldihydropteridine diphosphokinase